jgi:hypothetical protein
MYTLLKHLDEHSWQIFFLSKSLTIYFQHV